VIIVHVTHVALGLQSFRALEKDQEQSEEEHLMRTLHGVPFFLSAEKRSEKVLSESCLGCPTLIKHAQFSLLSSLVHSPHYVHRYTHKRTGMRMTMMMKMMKMMRERDSYAFL